MIKGIMLAASLFFVAGCATMEGENKIQEARRLIIDGKAECVLISGDRIISMERGRGVNPLLNVYDSHKDEMTGGIVVDKVIGRAAAAIAICGGARHVHGEVMSEDAVTFLKDNGITASSTMLVPLILNRSMDGRCPLELSVDGIQEPEKALEALRAKIASFSQGGK